MRENQESLIQKANHLKAENDVKGQRRLDESPGEGPRNRSDPKKDKVARRASQLSLEAGPKLKVSRRSRAGSSMDDSSSNMSGPARAALGAHRPKVAGMPLRPRPVGEFAQATGAGAEKPVGSREIGATETALNPNQVTKVQVAA